MRLRATPRPGVARTPEQNDELLREIDRLAHEYWDETVQELNCWRMFGIPCDALQDEVIVEVPRA